MTLHFHFTFPDYKCHNSGRWCPRFSPWLSMLNVWWTEWQWHGFCLTVLVFFCQSSFQSLLNTHISLCLRYAMDPTSHLFHHKTLFFLWRSASHINLHAALVYLPPLLYIWLYLFCMAYLRTLKMKTVGSSERLVPNLPKAQKTIVYSIISWVLSWHGHPNPTLGWNQSRQ
jgi:hypothetical protein